MSFQYGISDRNTNNNKTLSMKTAPKSIKCYPFTNWTQMYFQLISNKKIVRSVLLLALAELLNLVYKFIFIIP